MTQPRFAGENLVDTLDQYRISLKHAEATIRGLEAERDVLATRIFCPWSDDHRCHADQGVRCTDCVAPIEEAPR